MRFPVASSTQRNEVLFRVVPLLGTVLQVVHLKLAASSAVLASPAVAAEYRLAQSTVSLGIKPHSGHGGLTSADPPIKRCCMAEGIEGWHGSISFSTGTSPRKCLQGRSKTVY